MDNGYVNQYRYIIIFSDVIIILYNWIVHYEDVNCTRRGSSESDNSRLQQRDGHHSGCRGFRGINSGRPTARGHQRLADERINVGLVVIGVVPVARRTCLERCRLERVRRPGGQLVRLLMVIVRDSGLGGRVFGIGRGVRLLQQMFVRRDPLLLWLALLTRWA